jgi:hypothetical protein
MTDRTTDELVKDRRILEDRRQNTQRDLIEHMTRDLASTRLELLLTRALLQDALEREHELTEELTRLHEGS